MTFVFLWCLSLTGAFFVWLLLQICAVFLRKINIGHRKNILRQLGLGPAENRKIIGFFHPYCNAGGGGERVLWTAIASLQKDGSGCISVVYTGDIDVTKEEILEKVKARFNIELDPSTLHFVFLHSRKWVEDSQWPHFTLLGQSLGSIYLACEAMSKLIPDLFIDTMGYAFTFPIVSWLGRTPVGAYVHYPTISTDMLARVRSRRQWHTNASTISSSAVLSKTKLLYYRIFMYHYALSLRTASFLMANSSWTKNHVDAILKHEDLTLDLVYMLPHIAVVNLLNRLVGSKVESSVMEARIVYPPCDVHEISQFSLEGREQIILSVAQFRPEKDHPAQLWAFAKLLKEHPEYKNDSKNTVRLVLVGGSRNAEDAERVAELRKLAEQLELENHLDIIINAPYSAILEWLSRASVGLSTMVDEHFGINIVEFMAAGVIPVTHASGGPLQDIVVPFEGEPTGFHAQSVDEFAKALNVALTLSPEDDLSIRHRARASAIRRFSVEEFEKSWHASGWRQYVL